MKQNNKRNTMSNDQTKVRALKECCEAFEKGCREFEYYDINYTKWFDTASTSPADFGIGIYRPRPNWDKKPEMVNLELRDVLKPGVMFRWNHGAGVCYFPLAANWQGVWLVSSTTKSFDQVKYDYLRENAEYSIDNGETWHKCEKSAVRPE